MAIWTEDKINFLKNSYNQFLNKELAQKLDMKLFNIEKKAKELGLKKVMNKDLYSRRKHTTDWTEEKIQFLRQWYGVKTILQIVEVLGFTKNKIMKKALSIGLKSDRSRMSKLAQRDRVWTDEKNAQITELIPKFGIKETAKMLGLTKSSVSHQANRLSLKVAKSVIIKSASDRAIAQHKDPVKSEIIKAGLRRFFSSDEGKKMSKKRYETRIKNYSPVINYTETFLEQAFESLLLSNNIDYQKQKYYQGFIFDFFIPDRNLFVEIQGDYWHGNKLVYFDLNNMQNKKNLRDMVKKDKLIMLGHSVLWLWEAYIVQKELNINILNFEGQFCEFNYFSTYKEYSYKLSKFYRDYKAKIQKNGLKTGLSL